MRILFYHETPEWRGSARAVATLARGLSERGHSVTVVCSPDSQVEQRLELGAYEVLQLPESSTMARSVGWLRRVLQERFVQVVCVHSDQEQLVAATAARLAGRAALLRRVPPGTRPVSSSGARLALRFATTGFVFASDRKSVV